MPKMENICKIKRNLLRKLECVKFKSGAAY